MNYPTWSDLNSPSIVPPLGSRQAPDIGPAALMVSTEPDYRYISSNFGRFERQPFFTGSLMTGEDISVAGPYIGAPYAVMLLESLIAKGAKDIIILGWCGAISKSLSVGDLVVPDKAFVDEGTSGHYAELNGAPPCLLPDRDLSACLVHTLKSAGESPLTLPIWTTDAIYRETQAKVDGFRGKGAHAVEMECSALFAAAAFRGVRIAALLVVSDSLATEDGDWDPGFKNKKFKAMRKTACRQAVEITRMIGAKSTDTQ